MKRWRLRAIHQVDRARFALLRARHGRALECGLGVSPNFRWAELRLEPGGRLELGEGATTDRRPGNKIWVQRDGRVRLGPRVWLRTEHGGNRLTVSPGARIEIGADSLVNGVMLHAKSEITIGPHARLGFGARLLDADLHDLDAETPERVAPIRLGDRVWIGADAIVLRGVTIGDDTVVGAGSIVTRDLPPRVFAAGNPARIVRSIATREGSR